MKAAPNRTLQLVLWIILGMLVLRFLPILFRLIQITLSAVRAYWWILLPLLILGGIVRKMRRQNSALREFEHQGEDHPIKDVTSCADVKSEDNT